METILAITNSTNSAIKLIACNTYEEAIEIMKSTYNKFLYKKEYDYNNTFLDEDSGYAQIVSGLEQTEFRIGCVQLKWRENSMELYYEDYRIKVIKNNSDTYDMYDNKYGGRKTWYNVTKEQIDKRIEKVLSKRK